MPQPERSYISVSVSGSNGGYSNIFGNSTDAAYLTGNPFASSSYDGTNALSGITPDTTTQFVTVGDGITHDADAGRFRVANAGTYLIMVNVTGDRPTEADLGITLTHKIFKVSGITTTTLTDDNCSYHDDGPFNPIQNQFSIVADLSAGDLIQSELSLDAGYFGPNPNGRAFSCANGTTIIMFQLNGLYSGARYTAFSSAITQDGNVTAFDSDFGGTVATNLNGVTFTASNGTFAPSADRIFLYLSSWIYRFSATDTGNTVDHKLCRDGSSSGLQEVSVAEFTAASAGYSSTYMILKQVDDDQNASIKRDQDTTAQFRFRQGTSFSFIDISNNGTLPAAFFSAHINSDSPLIGTGLTNIYSETDRGSTYTLQLPLDGDLGTNTGITLNETNGRFTVDVAGAYLVLNNLHIDSSSDSDVGIQKLFVNGVEKYNASFYKSSTNDPVGNFLCSIVELNAGDYIEIYGENLEGDIDDGTGIVILKLDPNVVNTGKTKTFNNRDLSVLNPYDNATQYTLDKVPATRAVRQAPFILGARGYGITRENDTAIVVDPGDKSNTDD